MANSFFVTERKNTASKKNHSRFLQLASFLSPTSQHEWMPSSASTRTEVCPPALFGYSSTLWRRWVGVAWQWLWDENELENHPFVLQRLDKARQDFLDVLWDLQSYDACQLNEQINACQSMLDLWHLRSDVYHLVATHRGEAQAQGRLDRLNKHFSIRVNKFRSRYS